MRRRSFFALVLALCVLFSAAFAGERRLWALQGKIAYFEQDGKIGLINKSGNRVLITPILDEAHPFVKDIAAARNGDKWGLIDKQGRWVFGAESLIQIAFDVGGKYGLYSPQKGYWGFINPQGQVLIDPAPYAFAGIMSEGMFAAGNDQGCGYVDFNGVVAIPFEYEEALPFSHGLAAVRKDGKWGYINKQGEMALPFVYAEAGTFGQALAPVKMAEGDPTVYIDSEGKIRLEGKWDWGGDFTADKLAKVRIEGKYGYINAKGKVVISARHEDAQDFFDGRAGVTRDGEVWVVVNTKGKVISKNYTAVKPYAGGFTFVSYMDTQTKEQISGYIGKNGVMLCEQMP